MAHLCALEKLHFFDKTRAAQTSMHGYTKNIAEQAISISRYVTNIHKWIDDARLKLDAKLSEQ